MYLSIKQADMGPPAPNMAGGIPGEFGIMPLDCISWSTVAARVKSCVTSREGTER
jgi:hypothetical protein